MRISVFVIEVVRTLDELYNVRCSVRTVLVRSRNGSSPIEMWVFRQIEKGSKAHTAFQFFFKSGQIRTPTSKQQVLFQGLSELQGDYPPDVLRQAKGPHRGHRKQH